MPVTEFYIKMHNNSLKNYNNITTFSSMVSELLIKNKKIEGESTQKSICMRGLLFLQQELFSNYSY